MPRFEPLPTTAAWRHVQSRDGVEILTVRTLEDGHRLVGHTTALEGRAVWSIGYVVDTDAAWRTTVVDATLLSGAGSTSVHVERRSDDTWLVDGARAPALDGCVDIDLESSSVTNSLPLHRLDLEIDMPSSVPAAFIRSSDLRIERLEQTYARLERPGHVAYTSSTFDVSCELRYDPSGLILDYPGIAHRIH